MVFCTILILWLVKSKKEVTTIENNKNIILWKNTPYSTSQKIKDAFVPPNPNELDNEYFIFLCVASFAE